MNNMSISQHKGLFILHGDKYDILDCEICGFAHCLPIPFGEALEHIYSEEYYSKVKPEYVDLVEEDRSWHESTFISRLKILESMASGKRILEIGSGPGLFLEMARSKGWDVVGFEPSRQAWLYSREKLGLPVRNEFFTNETAKSLGFFDAAYLGLVLEHVPDPIGMIKLLKEHLVPGAAICVTVPNDFSTIQNFLAKQRNFSEWWISPPHHINYFNHGSVARLLERQGFTIQRLDSTFPMDLFLLMGFDYTSNKDLGRKCHELRMRFEGELARAGLDKMQNDIYAAMARYGVGREAIVYATL